MFSALLSFLIQARVERVIPVIIIAINITRIIVVILANLGCILSIPAGPNRANKDGRKGMRYENENQKAWLARDLSSMPVVVSSLRQTNHHEAKLEIAIADEAPRYQ